MAREFVRSFMLVGGRFGVSSFKYFNIIAICEKGGKKGGYLTTRPRTFNK